MKLWLCAVVILTPLYLQSAEAEAGKAPLPVLDDMDDTPNEQTIIKPATPAKAPAKAVQFSQADLEAAKKKWDPVMKEAREVSRAKIKEGVEKAVADKPQLSPEMKALLRSSSMQDRFLKIIETSAWKKAYAEPLSLDQKYDLVATAIRELRMYRTEDVLGNGRPIQVSPTLSGARAIEQYIAQSIDDNFRSVSTDGSNPVKPPQAPAAPKVAPPAAPGQQPAAAGPNDAPPLLPALNPKALEDAKAAALKAIKSGVEKALAKHPKTPAETKNYCLSATTHEQWLDTKLALRWQAIPPARLAKLTATERQQEMLDALRYVTDASIEKWLDNTLTANEEAAKQGNRPPPGAKGPAIGGAPGSGMGIF